MKAILGIMVDGECACGIVVAMTKQWCIYVDVDAGKYTETAMSHGMRIGP